MIGLALAVSTAVAGIVGAFSNHRVVAIAESHGIRQAGDFYMALVRDTAFQRIAPDIVIEFASRQSQALLDSYVVQCDSVPADTLRTIWRNTTKVAAWEFPVYARWLAAIREVNKGLPLGRRLHVLAGDTRVDWTTLHAPADWAALGPNNVSFSDVIDNVLQKGHRAFVVLGSNHLMRTGSRDGGANTTTMVESRFRGAMYVAWMYNGRPGSPDAEARMAREHWVAPSLVSMSDSWIGSMPVGERRFADLADALLYLGPADSLVVEEQAPPSGFDVSYRRELDRRSWIEWGDSARARTFLKLPALPPPGRVEQAAIDSRILRRRRQLWIYTPADYERECAGEDGCAIVVAFDGDVYTNAIPLPAILDSLRTAGAIAPTVAVMIANASGSERIADLGNRAEFARFLTDELIQWMRGRYRVTHSGRRTIITGSSAGGLAAAYAAFKRPDVFGNVLSQSGAFWRGNEGSNGAPFEWLTTQYEQSPNEGIRFFIDVGSAESTGAMGGTAPSILEANRRLRDVLKARGYAVDYFEIPGGKHDPSSWKLRLPIGLAVLDRP